MRTTVVSTKGSRQWQGIPAIERAANGRLWCAFYSGGPKEPDPANHILLTTSADDGVTWVDPVTVVDPPGSERAYRRRSSRTQTTRGEHMRSTGRAGLALVLCLVCAVSVVVCPGEPVTEFGKRAPGMKPGEMKELTCEGYDQKLAWARYAKEAAEQYA